MIKLKHILLEKDEKSDSENPDKILVKNKESGKSYYISKDSFDPSKHEKPKSKKSPKKDDDDKGKKKTDSKTSAGGVDLMAGLVSEPSGDKKDKEGEKEKKESPTSQLEKKLGSKVFVSDLEHKRIDNSSSGIRPDLKKKLLDFDYVNIFDDYNELQFNGASEEELEDISKKIQKIAIAKFAVISNRENDVEVIRSAKLYRQNSSQINKVLRKGEKLITPEELKKQFADKSMPKEFFDELKKTKAIYDMDDHFKTDGAKLENDITVYRSVTPKLIDDFVDAKEWIDNAFVSTSLNPIISEYGGDEERKPLLKIHLKKGNPVLTLPCTEDEFCIETEVTLPRGCKFTITDYNGVNNSYDVSVEFPNA